MSPVKKVMTAHLFLPHAKALDVFSLYRFLVECKLVTAMQLLYYFILFFAIFLR